MGDIIGSVLGTSTSTTQKTVPDQIAQLQNLERYGQLVNLFGRGSLNQFADVNPEGIYNPTDLSTDINSVARNNLLANQNIDYNNLMSLDQYSRSFDPVSAEYNNSLNRLDQTTDTAKNEASGTYEGLYGRNTAATNAALDRSYYDTGYGINAAGSAYNTANTGIDAAYNAAIARGDYDLARSLMTNAGYANDAYTRSGANAASNLNLNQANYLSGLDLNRDITNQGLGVNESQVQRALALANSDASRSLGTQDFNRARALELGIGATGNYIDQIATPRLNAALTLQGLESGGAVPAAIARATAETAMPYLQSIENAYGSNQANTLNALMGLKGTITGQGSAQSAELLQALLREDAAATGNYTNLQSGVMSNLTGLQQETANQLLGQQGAATEAAAAGNRALGGQLMTDRTQTGTAYQNNINQLAQAMMANNVSLEQAGISANSALGQQLLQVQNTLRTQQQQGVTALGSNYVSNAANFTQSLPGASQTLSLLPGQMQGQQAAYLTGLQGIADFPRQLKEADYLRRQGLFTTAYTGIPYTPGSTNFGGTATGNIFDQLGGTIQSGLKGGGNIGG